VICRLRRVARRVVTKLMRDPRQHLQLVGAQEHFPQEARPVATAPCSQEPLENLQGGVVDPLLEG
jgi:hypothetical protein